MIKIKQSKEFTLRPIKISDAKSMFECYQDKITQKNFMGGAKMNLKIARQVCKEKANEMRKKKPSGERFVIEVDGEFAGWASIKELNEKFFEHRGKVDYCIHPKFRKRGLATKATKLIVDYAFKKYKLKRIEGVCRDFNKASARVLEKCGFKLEGILRKNKCKNGKYLNDMVWAIVK